MEPGGKKQARPGVGLLIHLQCSPFPLSFSRDLKTSVVQAAQPQLIHKRRIVTDLLFGVVTRINEI